MAKIDYNSVFDGVSLSLKRAYPNCTVYGKSVNQGLEPKSFNVLPLRATSTGQLGARVQRQLLFDIIYYPTYDGGRVECLEVAETLPQILATIETPEGHKVHGSPQECEITDDVLHCTVSFEYFAYIPGDDILMEELQIELEG